MPNLSHDDKYWFRSGQSEWICFPFGLHKEGYIVPGHYRDRITRWTYWHGGTLKSDGANEKDISAR